ncbi:MAG: hypothetical protein ABFR53_07405 [Actinomycetota bacterium]
MNDTDRDIILAIADGQLTGQAKQDALARISADPELGEELAAQVAAMDDLEQLEPARMTSSERAALRSALVEQLNLQPAIPAVPASKRTRRWWQPVLGLASAAVLLVAIVVVPSMLSGSDDSSTDLVAIAEQTETTTESAEDAGADAAEDTDTATAGASDAQFALPHVEQQGVEQYFANAPPGQEESDTIADAAETVTTVAETAETKAADEGAADEEILEEGFARLAAPLMMVDRAIVEDCLDTLADSLPQGTHRPIAATSADSGIVVHFGVDTDDGVEHSVSIDIETCTITPLDP